MPTDTARPGRLGSYRRLFGYAAPYRAGWAAIVAATLTTTALTLAQPWPLKVLVDHVLGDRPLQGWAGDLLLRLPGTATPGGLLLWVVAAGLVIFALNSALETVIALQWTRVGRRMVYDLARDLFAIAQRRSLAAHTRHPVGDTIGRIALDAWCVHTIVDVLCIGPGHALVTLVVMVAVMLQLDAGLTLLALAVAPCMVAAAWVFRKPMRDAAHARRDIESRLQAHVHQTLTSVPVVQAFTREEAEQRRFDELTVGGDSRPSARRPGRQRLRAGLGPGDHARHRAGDVVRGDARARRPPHRRHGAGVPGVSQRAAVAAVHVRDDVHHAADGRRRRRPGDGRARPLTRRCPSGRMPCRCRRCAAR